MKKIIVILLFILVGQNLYSQGVVSKIAPDLQERILNARSDEMIPVMIRMAKQYDENQLVQQLRYCKGKEEKREMAVSELKRFSQSTQMEILKDLASAEKSASVADVESFWIFNGISCKMNAEMVNSMALRNDVSVVLLDEMRNMLPDGEESQPGEPIRGNAWNVTKVNADDVWNLGYTGTGVIVAVIDSGVNYNHTDIANNMWDGGDDYPNHGWDFAYDDNNPMDDNGHGTHCAGTVSSYGTNGTQCGIAKDAKIMALKVMNNKGEGSDRDIIDGVQFAVAQGADVLSLSLGASGIGGYWLYRDTFVNVGVCGAVASIAGGNDRDELSKYPIPYNIGAPGNCPPAWHNPDQTLEGGHSAVVTVGATTQEDAITYFSSEGPATWAYGEYIGNYNDYPYTPGSDTEIGLIKPDISAPGYNIRSLAYNSNSGYANMNGTSMATPCVAGVMALMLQVDPTLTARQIDSIMETTAVQCGGYTRKNNDFGAGRIDAYAIISSMLTACDPPINLTATVDGRDVTLTWTSAEGADSYNVYRDNVFVGNTTLTSFLDERVAYGIHQYRVKSKDANGNLSVPSSAVTANVVYFGPVPENLTGVVSGTNVSLWWDAPESSVDVLKYADLASGSSIGAGGNIYWGQRFPTDTLQNHINMAIDSVSIYMPYTGSLTTMLIYKIVDESYELLTSVDFTPTKAYDWNVVHLPQPVVIDFNHDMAVAFHNSGVTHPAAYCDYSGNGYEGLVSFNGQNWEFIMDYGFIVSWLIKTHISTVPYTYNLYRDELKVNDEGIAATSYIDENLAPNAAYQYQVKTIYNSTESNPSNRVGFAFGNTVLGDLELSSKDKMTVTSNSSLSVSGTLTNVNPANLILENDAQLIHNTPNVQATVKKIIDGYGTGNGNWYLLASPMASNVSAAPFATGEYDLYSYDEPTHYWMNSKDLNSGFNTLANGTGYLYASEADKQVVLSGELQPSNNHVDVPLSYTPSLNTLRGFNLVGNPFPCKAMLMGGNIAADFYVMNDDRDELEVSQNNIINPYEGIFVEATSPESVAQFYRWNPDYRGGESSASFDITVNEGRNEIDRARVRMGEGVGLGKFSLNENSARIYIPMDKQDYASVYVSGQNVLPLNFKPAKNGTYTLNFDLANVDLAYLHLIDNLTGVDVDLMAAAASTSSASYSFDAKMTDYASRFKLVFAEKQQSEETDDSDFVYFADGQMFAFSTEENSVIQIIDAAGRIVLNENVNGFVNKSLSLKSGVYVARMICGGAVKTQKFVAE